MSFQIQTSDFTVINGARNWQPRPPMKEAISHLGSYFNESYAGVDSGDTWVSFDNAFGRTTIFATPIDMETPEGFHLLDRLVVKTILPEDTWDMGDSQIVAVNALATTGALMRDPDTGALVIVSSATFIDGEGQDEWLRDVYVPIIASAAVFHPYCLVSWGNTGQSDTETNGENGLDLSDTPSRWGPEDFAMAEAALRQAGIFTNAGTTGLAAEFPWDDGGISWVSGDETSLLTLDSGMRHPHVGNGLFFKLELPTSFPEEQLIGLVHHLNWLEVTGADVPPFFGAWCSKIDSGRIAFVGFMPNLVYWPGSVTQVSAWLKMRSQNARASIGNFISRADT